ncbi:MAG: site-2 protease family protein [Chloroflexota bacterium]|nr:site-2 protease family protein [Chloroflexota bacterium]
MQRYTTRDKLVLAAVAILFIYYFGTTSRFGSIEGFVLFIGALILAVTFHEFAHAFVALQLGDWTAHRMGRVSLNPIRHLDLFGSMAFLFVGFGWGKPVPINPYNMRLSPAVGAAVSALAGPTSNVLFAFLVTVPLRFGLSPTPGTYEAIFWQQLFSVNILLAAFNFLPIPPLDGFSLARLVLPPHISDWLEQYGMFVLLALVFLPALIPGMPDIIQLMVAPLRVVLREIATVGL